MGCCSSSIVTNRVYIQQCYVYVNGDAQFINHYNKERYIGYKRYKNSYEYYGFKSSSSSVIRKRFILYHNVEFFRSIEFNNGGISPKGRPAERWISYIPIYSYLLVDTKTDNFILFDGVINKRSSISCVIDSGKASMLSSSLIYGSKVTDEMLKTMEFYDVINTLTFSL